VFGPDKIAGAVRSFPLGFSLERDIMHPSENPAMYRIENAKGKMRISF
jgi:hypothetical protein